MSKELFNSLIGEIQSGNIEAVESKISELTEEELDALFGEAQPYKALGTASSDKFVLGSVNNLREKYLKKLTTTAMVSFLFQMKDEYAIDEEHLNTPLNRDDFTEEVPVDVLPKDFNVDLIRNKFLAETYKARFPKGTTTLFKEMEEQLSEDDLLEVGAKTSAEYAKLTGTETKFDAAKYDEALDAALQSQSDSDRVVINRFLEWLFKYDSEKHSEKGGHEVTDDPERTDVETLKGTDVVYDNIPPNDTHCRFNAYYDINYEKLRDATHNIYNNKPDLEHAMIVYDVVDTQADVDAFIHKYGSSSKNDIVSFPLNRWTFMGPFKENRERVDYYNKHNNIIKEMMDQQEADNALGEDLLKKRIKSKKIKSEKVFGKDSPGFDEYKKLSPSELESKYNATVEDTEDGGIKVTREITVDAQTGAKLTLDDEGVPNNALEIPITTINCKTGESSQSRIFSEASD